MNIREYIKVVEFSTAVYLKIDFKKSLIISEMLIITKF